MIPGIELPVEPRSWPAGVASEERRRGMGLALKLHLFQIPICVVYAIAMAVKSGDSRRFLASLLIPAASIGTTQLIYLLPATAIEFSRGRRARALGIAICALVTLLVNLAVVLLFAWYLDG